MTTPSIETSTLQIAQQLINRQSITPEDAGCQNYIAKYLSQLGFTNQHMDFADTKNLWSIRNNASPCLIFAGHTDVVPPGDLNAWNTPPFQATIKGNQLFGRGAADMKGSLAAMLTACKKFISNHPAHQGSIGFLITSDEEGPFINGTVKVVEELIKRKQPIDYAIVGEPSSNKQLGDVIKIGRRGSLSGWIIFQGVQGHVAYPQHAKNAIHMASAFVNEITQIEWDKGNAYFPASSLQITHFNAGEAGNIIPGEAKVSFNFRYSSEQTYQNLQKQIRKIAKNHADRFDLQWKLNGEPYLTQSNQLINIVADSVEKICQIRPSAETSGGTSDGRFIAKTGAQIVELGPINQTIHQVNECVNINDLEKLSDIYFLILKKLLAEN